MSERNFNLDQNDLSRINKVDHEGNLLLLPRDFAICAHRSVPAVHAEKLGNRR